MKRIELSAWAAAIGAGLLALCLASCRGGTSSGRVIILGLDGVDPAAVDLLMSEGKLPHFARMRQEGAYGKLISARPLLSPVLWTTIATGKTPDVHRIGHFVAINEKTGEQLPVTSRMRRARALWNILSEAGKSVAVVGWWATWPAETVRGSMVTDHLCYHFLMEEGVRRVDDMTGVSFPAGLAARLAPLVKRHSDLTAEDLAPYVDVPPSEISRPFDFDDDLSHFKWALATAETHSAIGLHLWEEERPDLSMVYIEGTDSTSHLFGHLFRAEALSGELAEQQARYGRAVEQIYQLADRIVGEYMKAMDSSTTLIVLSDHGFQLGALQDDPSKTRDMRRVSEQFHTLEGIVYLHGNRVRKGARLDRPTLVDIAPTVLALAGLAPARDMAGRVLTEGLDLTVAHAVPTYESEETPEGEWARDDAADPEILERLRSLGYLDATSPTGDRNVAAILFEEGRYDEAVKMFERLVREKPDDAALRTSLAGALGALGRYDEAMRELGRAIELDPLNPEAYHNRAVIHERRGDREAAVRDYRTAIRYTPQYEPSRAALARLLEGEPPQTASPAHQLAYKIAEQASQAARRGDYPEAMRRLDEAERIAPRFGLIYQYRSNVAYLMGDREAAINALKKGLELEPDNALFRENLRHLERQSSARGTHP